MAPFPETEIMTIKRLEVALRKMDFKLLKDGAYKLHEKYHSGHKFEYLDLLKEILMDISNNASVPDDIKDIICPTIRDILSEEGIQADTTSSPYESLNQNRVSSLTSLSYGGSDSSETTTVTEEQANKEYKVSAFDVFGADKSTINTTSPFETSQVEPFKEFSVPDNISHPVENSYSLTPEPEKDVQQQIQYEKTTLNEQYIQEPEPEYTQNSETEYMQGVQSEQKLKDVSIFYLQDNSPEKIKNILRYKELISKLEDEHYSITEILKLISEINTQSNTNVSELKNILDQLQINKNKVNLITNSSSSDLIGLLEQGEYSYSLWEANQDKQMNIIPVFGLSNQFVCSHCGEEYLDKADAINPLVLQCPRCKNPMFPNFYAANNQNIQMNIEYYNNALLSLASSKVWVVIHPLMEDKIMSSLLLNALRLNNVIEDIYILDKDINIRETFREQFISIKENVNINIQMSALEDFMNSIRRV